MGVYIIDVVALPSSRVGGRDLHVGGADVDADYLYILLVTYFVHVSSFIVPMILATK